MFKDIRDEFHWKDENYKQRMTTKQWSQLLLRGDDKLIVAGRVRTLKAKRLGYGVVEISKEPLKEE